MKVLIGKNVNRPTAGIVQEVLEERGDAYRVHDFNFCEDIDSEEYDAVIVMGGPDSANDATPKMEKERALVKRTLERNIPYLGICLGMQVMIKVTGGRIEKNPVPELGFRGPDNAYNEVLLNSYGKEDRLFRDVPPSFRAFQFHYETARPNSVHTILGRGRHCEHQVIRYGNRAYGTQFHFELTPELFDKAYKNHTYFAEAERKQVEIDFRTVYNEYRVVGRQIMKNFLDIAEKYTEKMVARNCV
jgi:GMP synthase (glutamine-hydrolysing)